MSSTKKYKEVEDMSDKELRRLLGSAKKGRTRTDRKYLLIKLFANWEKIHYTVKEHPDIKKKFKRMWMYINKSEELEEGLLFDYYFNQILKICSHFSRLSKGIPDKYIKERIKNRPPYPPKS
jgi:hypothetical protein